MNKLSIICQPNDFTGHGIHACNVIRRLPKMLDVEIVVRPTSEGPVPDDIKPLVKPGKNDAGLEIILGPASIAPTDFTKTTVYLTTCESTRPSDMSINILNSAAAVVVPSNFCATVFSARGVNCPLHVVPLGYSENFPFLTMMPGTFTFACAGQLNNGFHRKGLQRVVDLFLQAFPNGEDVALNVKTMPGDPAINASDLRVLHRCHNMSENEVAGWLAQCHCFVNLATEGFGLWPLQAMAMGRPIISPLYGGVADFHHGIGVKHRMVPARDAWEGIWAEADDDSVIQAMQYAAKNRPYMQHLGLEAYTLVSPMTWQNSIQQLADILQPLLPVEKPVEEITSGDPLEDVTVCITAFNRPKYLERAKASAMAAGFKVVVAEMSPDNDLGCNELWLRAAYKATTKRVIILHDDDVLLPELGDYYVKRISPMMDQGYAVTWRAAHFHDDGRVTTTEYCDAMSGPIPYGTGLLLDILQRSQLSLSPIVTVFDRVTLIHACKEAATIPMDELRPGMELGTEVLAHLRQAQGKGGWLYLDKVLSHYGVHDGSGTVQAEKAGNLAPLIAGYDKVRKYFRENARPTSYAPKVFFAWSDYNSLHEKDLERQSVAYKTWTPFLNRPDVISTPIHMRDLPRGYLLPFSLPYVKDLFNYAYDRAMMEDIIILTNADVCFTTRAIDLIKERIKHTGFVACPRHNMEPIPTGKLFESVKEFKQDGGYDVFAVTPTWWRNHRDKMPDMFLGREAWDTVLRRIGEEVSGEGIYVDDVCYHQAHFSQWQRERMTSPSNLHNRKLALEFFKVRSDKAMIKQLSP